ncbi:unnamed protein product [Vitrella brassicaformis CCMP3155]|uniref:Uncharacterized protein n=1 Tax=Vitrella brassicaformis (strain CCMP3155) TaxID=1169540 RepID=A0A0G4FHD8_VITBC|nr:unnamed protein product [Vitrella brassicaformis CCMP3155]|eukprot:CEM12924.1 unnamed protein product [Vitrella brassicaformis CCMP3155]
MAPKAAPKGGAAKLVPDVEEELTVDFPLEEPPFLSSCIRLFSRSYDPTDIKEATLSGEEGEDAQAAGEATDVLAAVMGYVRENLADKPAAEVPMKTLVVTKDMLVQYAVETGMRDAKDSTEMAGHTMGEVLTRLTQDHVAAGRRSKFNKAKKDAMDRQQQEKEAEDADESKEVAEEPAADASKPSLDLLIIAQDLPATEEQLESLIGTESLPFSGIVHLEPLGLSDVKYASLHENEDNLPEEERLDSLFLTLDELITKGAKAADTTLSVIPNCARVLAAAEEAVESDEPVGGPKALVDMLCDELAAIEDDRREYEAFMASVAIQSLEKGAGAVDDRAHEGADESGEGDEGEGEKAEEAEKDETAKVESDQRVYERLVSSIDPFQHDVPVLLHCLVEQVAVNQEGSAALEAADAENQIDTLRSYLDVAQNRLSAPSLPPPPPPCPPPPPTTGGSVGAIARCPVIAHRDQGSCRHVGQTFSGGPHLVDVCHRMTDNVLVPGPDRRRFPEWATLLPERRSALRSRLMPFLGFLPACLADHALLLHELTTLLNQVQPERCWGLQSWRFRERVSASIVAEAMGKCVVDRDSWLMATQYVPRMDALLVVFHQRALPGRCYWHCWNAPWLGRPSFIEWRNFIKGGPVPSMLYELPAQSYHHLRHTTKVITPADGSIMVVTTQQHGAQRTHEFLPTPIPPPPKEETDPKKKRKAKKSAKESEVPKDPLAPPPVPPGYDPPATHCVRWGRIYKEDLTMGIYSDETWAKRKEQLLQAVEAYDAAVEELMPPPAGEQAAEGEEENEGEEAAEETPPAEQPAAKDSNEEPPRPKERDQLSALSYGVFWLTFDNHSRLTVQMHHSQHYAVTRTPDDLPAPSESNEEQQQATGDDENAPPAPQLDLDQLKQPCLSWPQQTSPLGVLLTYASFTGLTIQCMPDGSVAMTPPTALPFLFPSPHDVLTRVALIEARLQMSEGEVPGTDEGQQPRSRLTSARYYFGCVEDEEVGRRVLGSGVVVRELMSGRLETLCPDGTLASRNPTRAELTSRRSAAPPSTLPLFDALISLLDTRACDTLEGMGEVDTEKNIWRAHEDMREDPWGLGRVEQGVPGHWLVCRPDARRFGRFHPDQTSLQGPAAESEGEEAAEGQAAETQGEAEQPVYHPQVFFGAVLVEGGWLEYPLGELSIAIQRDPHTHDKVVLAETEVAIVQSPPTDGKDERVALFGDGTRIVTSSPIPQHPPTSAAAWRLPDNTTITVEKEGYAKTVLKRTYPSGAAGDAGALTTEARVICPDKTQLQVVREIIAERVENFDPNNALLSSARPTLRLVPKSARACLRRPDGTLVRSNGCGNVRVAWQGEGTTEGESDPIGLYVAHCDENLVRIEDAERNKFTLIGDGSSNVELAVAISGEPSSPRCRVPNTPYCHPDRTFLPLPPEAPRPRLFVVYGQTGEADELLHEKEAGNVLQKAADNPEMIVPPARDLDAPFEGCRLHTIYHYACAKGPRQPMQPLKLPPVVAGVDEQTDDHNNANGKDALVMRHLLEYQELSEDQWAAFTKALQTYAAWEQHYGNAPHHFDSASPDNKGDKNGGSAKGKKGGKKAKGESEAAMALLADAEVPMPLGLELESLTVRSGASLDRRASDWNDEAIACLRSLLSPHEPQDAAQTITAHAAPLAETFREVGDGDANLDGYLMPSSQQLGLPREPSIALSQLSSPAPGQVPPQWDLGVDETAAALPRRVPVLKAGRSLKYFETEEGIKWLMTSGMPMVTPAAEIARVREDREMKRSMGKEAERWTGHGGDDDIWAPLPPSRSTVQQPPSQPFTAEGTRPVTKSSPPPPTSYFDTPPPSQPRAPPPLQVSRGFVLPPQAPVSPFRTGTLPIPGVAAPKKNPFPPHPNKKSASFDVYGRPREVGRPRERPFMTLNPAMYVEGPVDRRVRVAAVASRKNAAQAPSVSTLRMTGAGLCAAMQRGSVPKDTPHLSMVAYNALKGHVDSNMDLMRTASMQGLGDPNTLVQVEPPSLRFGPLRQGHIYRLHFKLRNFDVDVCRFNVKGPQSNLINIHYTPQAVPPGLALPVTVELCATVAARVEQIVSVRHKAHILQLPVIAEVLEPEQFDRLHEQMIDAQGRPLLKKTIEVVSDPKAIAKKLGPNAPLPPDTLTKRTTAHAQKTAITPAAPEISQEVTQQSMLSGGETSVFSEGAPVPPDVATGMGKFSFRGNGEGEAVQVRG